MLANSVATAYFPRLNVDFFFNGLSSISGEGAGTASVSVATAVTDEDGSSGEGIDVVAVEADWVAEGYNDTVATRRFRDGRRSRRYRSGHRGGPAKQGGSGKRSGSLNIG